MANWWCHPSRRVSSSALIGALIVALLGIACREKPSAQPSRRTLRISAAFGPLTEPLAKEYRRALPNIDVQMVPAVSSTDVIHAIVGGTADFGVSFSDDTYAGYWNQATKNASQREIRAVALLQPLAEHLLVRGNSGIRQIKDLNGKVVGVGPKENTSSILGLRILEAFAVHPASI